MGTIEIPPDMVDKALAVLVDDARSVLAVWKGRGRVDLYDFTGTWHEVTHPYPRQEEGLWSRDDVLRSVAETLATAEPPPPIGVPLGATIKLELKELCQAQLVRATPLVYALWKGAETIDIYSRDGLQLRTVRVPTSDLPTISQLMHDILEVCELVVELQAARNALGQLTPLHR